MHIMRMNVVMYCNHHFSKDSLFQKLTTIPRNKQFNFIYKRMKESFSSIMEYFIKSIDPEMNQQVLEAVGGLRFALKFAADCISQKISPDSSATVITWLDHEVQDFLTLTETSCSHHLIKLEAHKPRVFLFKLLFRRHGAVVVEFCTTKQPKFAWLVSGLRDIQVNICTISK